ncbi:MAG: hypothetical protein WD845_16705 [Pirellulales bacterium]
MATSAPGDARSTRTVPTWAIRTALLATACSMILGVARADDDLDARRKEIAALSPADQQELLRKHERFLALPAAEQDRLRNLQAAIDADPESERLRQVLAGYHEWLKTLSTGQRSELAAKSPAERVKEIQRILRHQEVMRRNDLLTHRDKREVIRWIEELLWQQREQLIAGMDKRRREWFEQRNEEDQRRALIGEAIERTRRSRGQSRVDISEEDVQRLAKRLSQRPQEELAKQPDLADRRNVVGGWIFSTWIERMDYGRGPRRPAPLPEADVAQFFENELPAPKREELMSLPQSEAREQLRRMYFDRDERGPFFRDGRSGRGGPRGDRPRTDAERSERDRHQRPDSDGQREASPPPPPVDGAQPQPGEQRDDAPSEPSL